MKSLVILILFSFGLISLAFGENKKIEYEDPPIILDSDLRIERFVTGLEWPTSMTFVGEDLLILEKNNGKVKHVKDGILQEDPVLDVEVNGIGTRGMLGITSVNEEVYIFFTEAKKDNGEIIGNRIYKYSWNGEKLTNQTLIKEFSLDELRPEHMGGILITNLDGKVVAVTGDNNQEGKNQNFITNKNDDSGGVFIIDDNERFATGIRNSFGLTVDPITGNIWDTENGPAAFDEINLVLPKFNSGWKVVMGPATEKEIEKIPKFDNFIYSDPEFSFESTVAITAISFVTSEKFEKFKNSVIVGDYQNGHLYKFNLNEDRTGFVFDDPRLQDLVANFGDPLSEIILASGFNGITDIEMGPDGTIYIVTLNDGSIHKIEHNTEKVSTTQNIDCNADIKPKINLSGCELSGKSFSNLDLSFANFSNAKLSNSSFNNSILNHADFSHTELTNSNFSNSLMIGTIFTESDLKKSIFTDSKMRMSIFDKTELENANLSNVNMKTISFDQSNMVNVDLSSSTIFFSNFKNANLYGANFEKSELTNSIFVEANLQESNLHLTDIYGVDFSGSDLSGANLLGTYPYSTNFENVKYSNKTETDSCLNTDLSSRALNKILREIRERNFILFEPFEHLIIQICSPS